MTAPFATEARTPRRILALWFPYLPTERLLRQRLGRSWRAAGRPEGQAPLVVSRREDNTLRVAALDEPAEALRLRRGMGLADARAMHPGIEVVEADGHADRRLLEGIADWCDRYTPLVALDGADGLFLDITGCAHLFGGEKAMLDDMLRRLFHQGFAARGGLAATPGAAWAAARFLPPRPLAAGAEADALAPLPLAALRLDAATRTGLEGVGLRTAGAVLAAPRAPLARRFGRHLLLRIDQAVGRVEEAVSPRLPVPPLSVERHLAEPVTEAEEIERLVLALAGTLKADLERRGEGARVLLLSLFRVDGAVARHRVGAARPLRAPDLIRRLLRERLAASAGSFEPGCGFELVRLCVLEAGPFEQEQTDLGGASGDDGADLALLADRLRARLGDDVLTAQLPAGSHVPERAVAAAPFALAPAGQVPAARDPAPERPIRLLSRPEPVEVVAAEVPEGPPLHFRWRRALHRVARAEGPERIAAEWWIDGEEAPPRDYFRIEDGDGRRYWLYREGLYGRSAAMPRWYMHGLFA